MILKDYYPPTHALSVSLSPEMVRELARLSCEVNDGKWPKEFGREPTPIYTPPGWRRFLWPFVSKWAAHEYRLSRSIAAMRVIDALIGHKEVLRYHNTVNRRNADGTPVMTNDEFEAWWQNRELGR